MTVAALYVDVERGPYASMPGVECWGVERDATTYAGPHPVVAHPPCGHWGRYHQRCHDDGRTGPVAVEQVRRWGGVLEQPRDSKLWRECRIPLPGWLPDQWGGWSLLVYQHDWGHRASKPTWLYVVGVLPEDMPPMPPRLPDPVEPPTPGQCRGILERMSKSQRHLTPPAFAVWLVEVARRSHVTPPI